MVCCETFYNINYNYVVRHRCKFVTSRRVEGATFAKIPLETISLWLSIRDMFIETDRCEMSPRCIYLNTKMWKPRAITVADKYRFQSSFFTNLTQLGEFKEINFPKD